MRISHGSRSSERWRLEQVEARIEARLAALRRTRRLVRDALAACDSGHCRLAGETGAT